MTAFIYGTTYSTLKKKYDVLKLKSINIEYNLSLIKIYILKY